MSVVPVGNVKQEYGVRGSSNKQHELFCIFFELSSNDAISMVLFPRSFVLDRSSLELLDIAHCTLILLVRAKQDKVYLVFEFLVVDEF